MSDPLPAAPTPAKTALVSMAMHHLKRADEIDKLASRHLDRAILLTNLAELPEDLAMRVCLMPHPFAARA
jgi:hypothetical protein